MSGLVDDSLYMSPEKRAALQKLREQELALDKQSFAIQTVLAKLDSAYHQHSGIGASLYSSLSNGYETSKYLPTNRSLRRDSRTNEMLARFTDHVAATNKFQLPEPLVATHLVQASKERANISRRSINESFHAEDDTGSYIGEDVLAHTKMQLSKIREQRATTLAQRLQQKQEAFIAAEQNRLNALHEIRHRAAMEIAARHHTHRHYWAAIRYLYNNVKARSNLTMADYRWKVVALMSAVQRLMQHVHYNGSSDAPHLALLLRTGWRVFNARVREQAEAHLCDVQADLVADQFRAARSCRRVLVELFSTVRRKALTSATIDSFRLTRCCSRALQVMKQRLLGQHHKRLARVSKVMLVDMREKRLAFLVLVRNALRSRRNRAIVQEDWERQATHALASLRAFARRSRYLRECLTDGALTHREGALSAYMRAWHRSATLRAHRRYCAALAAAHQRDITAKTGAHWLREHMRSFMRRWYSRVELRRRRLLPVRHFKSKRNRQQVQALLRAWRLRVATATAKRRAAGAKVRSLRLRWAWAWYREELAVFRSRAQTQKAIMQRPRSRYRHQCLLEGFADFRAYVVGRRERRAQTKQLKVKRAVVHMTTFLSELFIRLTTRRTRRAATHARLKALSRQCFRRWRSKASVRLKARWQSIKTQVVGKLLLRAWDKLVAFTAARKTRRERVQGAKAAVREGRMRLALTAWGQRTDGTLASTAAYAHGKAHWRRGQLLEGLGKWVLRRRARAVLGRKGVYRVRPGEARRLSFLRRWLAFLGTVRDQRAHDRSFGRAREAAQMHNVVCRLRQAVLDKAAVAQTILQFREEVITPLLQGRFFNHMLQRKEAAEARRSDPRLLHRQRHTCRWALRTWRKYRSVRKQRARSLRLGERNCAILSGLRALAQWRYIAHLHSGLVESARQAARLYRRKYFAPAFKNWLRNTAALAHQFDARYLKHGDLLKKSNARRVLSAFRRIHHLHKHLTQAQRKADQHAHRAALRKAMDKLQTTAVRLQLRARRKQLASTHRAQVIKRIAFAGLKAYLYGAKRDKALVKASREKHAVRIMRHVFAAFQAILRDSETPGFGRAGRYHAKRSLRKLMAVWKNRSQWAVRLKKGRPFWRRAQLNEGLTAFRSLVARRRASKALVSRVSIQRRTARLRRGLQQWLHNRFARRTAQALSAGALRKLMPATSLSDVWNLGNTARSRASISEGSVGARSPGRGEGEVGMMTLSRSSSFSGPPPLQRTPGFMRIPGQLSRAPSLRLVRRRSAVNPASFSKLRRFSLALRLWASFTTACKEDREMHGRVEHAMGQYRQHTHMLLWRGWVQDVVAEKLQVIQGALHMDSFHLKRVLPALQRILRQHRHIEGARLHHLYHLMQLGWLRWAKYACTGLRRARAQAKAQKRALEKEAAKRAAPQFVDDDFSHRRSSSFGGPASPGVAPVAAVAEPADHRVTVQRARLVYADEKHLEHSVAHALARWRHWFTVQYHHRKLVYACLHRQLESVMQRFRQHMLRAKQRRANARRALAWRRYAQLRQVFSSLRQNRALSVAYRRLLGLRTRRILQAWKLKVKFRTKAKHALAVLEDIHHTRLLQAAWAEWVADCAVETALLVGLKDLRRHRLHHGIDHLVYHCKLKRRRAALMLRSRKFKTHRLLRKVYTNLLREMSIRYRTIEVLRECNRHHNRYHCRHVIYNLFYLRRNRIAKDHNLRLKFQAFVAALRLNRAVVRHCKGHWARANAVIMRKTLWQLYRQAKEGKSKARRLRAVGSVLASRSNRCAALVSWARTNALRRGLKSLQRNIASKRRHRKLTRWSVYACMKRQVYRCFRLLLSHARKRNLKRRNSGALYSLFLNMQLRRAVSRLDVNVSNKWARQQEQRLMLAYSASRDKQRAIKRLAAHGLEGASAGLTAAVLEGGRQRHQDRQHSREVGDRVRGGVDEAKELQQDEVAGKLFVDAQLRVQ